MHLHDCDVYLCGMTADCRRNRHLSLMYKSLHGLALISTSPFRHSSSPLVQLMATRFVSCLLELILTSTLSILVPLLTGMPSRYLWSLVLPFIRSTVRYIPAWRTPDNHTLIPAVTGGNPWPAITEEPKALCKIFTVVQADFNHGN